MFKSTIVAAILATATSFAVAQVGGAVATSSGATEGASQTNVAPAATKSSKHAKSKKSTKTSTAAGSSDMSAPVTGATGTTAAGTPGMATSGATKPAGTN